MKIFFSLLILASGFSACRKSPKNFNPEQAFLQTNVPYGKASLQDMDISFVAHRSDTTPLVILIHGGAWMGGDKADLTQATGSFTAEGINVANINYRLTDASTASVRAGDLLADVGSAIKMLHDRAAEWHIRSSGYVSFGFSAGAHLSLLYGYSYDSSNLVSGVIGLGAPTKFDDPQWGVAPYLAVAETALPPLTGQPFSGMDTGSVVLKKLSPWYQPRFKPTFLIHGEKDQTVPFSQSQAMLSKLEQAGEAVMFVPLANAGHTGEGASEADLEAAYAQSMIWIRTYSH